MLKTVISKISAKYFFYLNIIYSILTTILIYLLIKDFTIGLIAPFIGLPVTLVVTYRLLHPPIVKNPAVYFFIPLLVILQTISSDFLYESKIINERANLHKLIATIPTQSTKYTYGKAFNHRSFLVLDNKMLRCGRDRFDDCPLIYSYAGQQATILYSYFDTYRYAKNKKANTYLVYEIDVNGEKIYDFDSQRNKFLAVRANLIHQLALLYVLLFIPQLLLGYCYIQVSRNLPSMTLEEQKAINEQKRLRRIHDNRFINLVSGELTIAKASFVLGILAIFMAILYVFKMYWGLLLTTPFAFGLMVFIILKWLFGNTGDKK